MSHCLALPIPKACFRVAYTTLGVRRTIRLFPTVQFVYSHHIKPQYMDEALRSAVKSGLRQPEPGAAGSGSVLILGIVMRKTMPVVR